MKEPRQGVRDVPQGCAASPLHVPLRSLSRLMLMVNGRLVYFGAQVGQEERRVEGSQQGKGTALLG